MYFAEELVPGYGVYFELDAAEQCSNNSATVLMRSLMAVWYTKERLAACSATSGLNDAIRTAVLVELNLWLHESIVTYAIFFQSTVKPSIAMYLQIN